MHPILNPSENMEWKRYIHSMVIYTMMLKVQNSKLFLDILSLRLVESARDPDL